MDLASELFGGKSLAIRYKYSGYSLDDRRRASNTATQQRGAHVVAGTTITLRLSMCTWLHRCCRLLRLRYNGTCRLARCLGPHFRRYSSLVLGKALIERMAPIAETNLNRFTAGHSWLFIATEDFICRFLQRRTSRGKFSHIRSR